MPNTILLKFLAALFMLGIIGRYKKEISTGFIYLLSLFLALLIIYKFLQFQLNIFASGQSLIKLSTLETVLVILAILLGK